MKLKDLKNRFFNIWKTTDDTGQQVARGSILVLLSRVLIKSLQLIKTIILARLLFPEDFGLFGLASLTMTFVGTIFQHGFNTALVHHKESNSKYLNGAWTVNILRNTLVALVLFFIAPNLAAGFFNNINVIPFIKVLAIIVFFEGFQNIGVILLNKELRFNKKFFYDISAVFIEISAVIIAAFYLRSPWALLIGVAFGKFADIILSYVFHSYRPRFKFNLEVTKQLFKFGKWIGLAGIITFITRQGDAIMIGKLLTTYDLGLYSLALSLGTLPSTEISKVMGNVLFPFFSKIQNDLELLKSSFIRLFRVLYAFIIPALIGIFTLNNEIVYIVYGSKWTAMIPILNIVLIIAILRSFELIVNPLFLGIGKPKINTYILTIQSIIMFSLIVPLAKMFGVVGIALSVASSLLISQSILFFKISILLDNSTSSFFSFSMVLTE